MRSQITIYDDEFRAAIEGTPENALVMIQDDFRSLLKHFARSGQAAWADMCEMRVQALLDELTRQYEIEAMQGYRDDSK
jgi:hypothetical protein